MLNIKQFTIKEITFIVVKINTVRTFLLIKKNEGNKKNKSIYQRGVGKKKKFLMQLASTKSDSNEDKNNPIANKKSRIFPIVLDRPMGNIIYTVVPFLAITSNR